MVNHLCVEYHFDRLCVVLILLDTSTHNLFYLLQSGHLFIFCLHKVSFPLNSLRCEFLVFFLNLQDYILDIHLVLCEFDLVPLLIVFDMLHSSEESFLHLETLCFECFPCCFSEYALVIPYGLLEFVAFQDYLILVITHVTMPIVDNLDPAID